MAALTADRDTQEKASTFGMEHNYVGTDSTQYYKGGIVCILNTTGKVVKGATATTHVCIGRCEENVLTGTSNTRGIKIRSGIFKYVGATGGGDDIATDDIGKLCYIVDDQTVGLVSTSRSVAGTVYDVDADGGIWVAMKFPTSAA